MHSYGSIFKNKILGQINRPAVPVLRAMNSQSILDFTRVALANATNRDENQITSGYRWWGTGSHDKAKTL
jgi:hypothetical protein